MFRAVLTFFAGLIIILLILGAISAVLQETPTEQNRFKDTQSLHLEADEPDDLVVRSEQTLSDAVNDEAASNDSVSLSPSENSESQKDAEKHVEKEIEILLAEEASLTSIIETNISLLGSLGNAAAFLSHQTILREINRTEGIQPISIICSNTRCNVLVYGNSPENAEAFAQTLINGVLPNVNTSGGEYRVFNEEGYDFAHVVLELQTKEKGSPQ